MHRIVEEVIDARKDATPQVSWGMVVVRRYNNYLYLERKSTNPLTCCIDWATFPVPLTLNLKGIPIYLLARKAKQGVVLPLGAKVSVKFRQGGEIYLAWSDETFKKVISGMEGSSLVKRAHSVNLF